MLKEDRTLDKNFGIWLSQNSIRPELTSTPAERLFEHISTMVTQKEYDERDTMTAKQWQDFVKKIAGADGKKHDLMTILRCPDIVEFVEEIMLVPYYQTGEIIDPTFLKSNLMKVYGKVSVKTC